MTDRRETLTEISWRRTTRKNPENNYFFTISEDEALDVNGGDARITFIGNFAERNGSLQISNVSLDDEGSYTCVFTLFPSGSHQTVIPLHLQVPPSTIISDNPVILGNEEVLVANCTAAGSRPAAQVTWLTGALGKKVTEKISTTQHDNGTTTTVASLFAVPKRELNGQEVECVVKSAALSSDQNLHSTIQVFFPPMNVTIVERSDNTLECISEGNPKPSFRWTRHGKTLPESDFRVEGGVLTILTKEAPLNDVYQCEASNPHGQELHGLYLMIRTESSPAPWVLFGLLLSLNVIGAVWYAYRYGWFARIGLYNLGRREPSHSSPPEREPVNERDAHFDARETV
ncbi:unnamed protein product [Ophioblennius macclurei]